MKKDERCFLGFVKKDERCCLWVRWYPERWDTASLGGVVPGDVFGSVGGVF